MMLSGCSAGGAQDTTSAPAATTSALTEPAAATTAPGTTTAVTTAEERDPALDMSMKDMFLNLNVASKTGKYLGETFEELYVRYMNALEKTGRSTEWEKLCRTVSAVYDFAGTPQKKLFIDCGFALTSADVDAPYYNDVIKPVLNGLGDSLREKMYTEGNTLSLPGLLWLPEEYDEYVSGGFGGEITPRKKGGKLRVLLIDKSETITSQKDKIGKYFYNSYDVGAVRSSDWFDSKVYEDAKSSLLDRASKVYRVLSLSGVKPGFVLAATPSEADIILEYECSDGTAQNYSSGSDTLTLWLTEFRLNAVNNFTGESADVRFGYSESPETVQIPAGANRYGALVSPFPEMAGTPEGKAFAETLASWFTND